MVYAAKGSSLRVKDLSFAFSLVFILTLVLVIVLVFVICLAVCGGVRDIGRKTWGDGFGPQEFLAGGT